MKKAFTVLASVLLCAGSLSAAIAVTGLDKIVQREFLNKPDSATLPSKEMSKQPPTAPSSQPSVAPLAVRKAAVIYYRVASAHYRGVRYDGWNIRDNRDEIVGKLPNSMLVEVLKFRRDRSIIRTLDGIEGWVDSAAIVKNDTFELCDPSSRESTKSANSQLNKDMFSEEKN